MQRNSLRWQRAGSTTRPNKPPELGGPPSCPPGRTRSAQPPAGQGRPATTSSTNACQCTMSAAATTRHAATKRPTPPPSGGSRALGRRAVRKNPAHLWEHVGGSRQTEDAAGALDPHPTAEGPHLEAEEELRSRDMVRNNRPVCNGSRQCNAACLRIPWRPKGVRPLARDPEGGATP